MESEESSKNENPNKAKEENEKVSAPVFSYFTLV